MLNLVLFGAPGSGKGTQSEKIIEGYGLFHISTGEVLRDHIRRGTELGKIADSYISKGNLIPDDLMIRILDDVLENKASESDSQIEGVVFDGFPRTIPQAEALAGLLEKRGTELHAVIGLEVPEEELMDRMIQRGKMTGRADDTPETIKNRLDVYHKQTMPLKDFYMSNGKYLAINGHGEINDIFEEIASKIEAATGVGRKS